MSSPLHSKNEIKHSAITHICSDSSLISSYFLCDNTFDCNKGNGEDEGDCNKLMAPSNLCSHIKSLDLTFYSKICPYDPKSSDKTEAPNIVDNNFCIYTLEAINKSMADERGLHLTNCDDFVCNSTYFKCPGFYCIPWQYVCNRRIDCPGGLEERNCSTGSCLLPVQLKCRSSAICVAMEDICNGVADCPFQDDEYYCKSFNKPCPNNCICLLYVIECLHVDFLNDTMNYKHHLPFVKVTILNAHLTNELLFFQMFNQTVFLSLHRSNVSDICFAQRRHLANSTISLLF